MKKVHLLITLTGLLIGFLFMILGLFLFFNAGPVVNFFLTLQVDWLSYFGLSLLLIGAGLLSLLYYLSRRQYLLLTMGGISVDEKVIAQYVIQNVKGFFPGQSIECDVVVKRSGRLEIITHIPRLSPEESEKVLGKIEERLTLLMQKQFLYNKPFLFNVSFFDPQPTI